MLGEDISLSSEELVDLIMQQNGIAQKCTTAFKRK